MKYGNCLTGAIILLWTKKYEKPRLLLKTRPGTKIPHFMVKSKSGVHHYKTEKDLLPWPLCYVIFEGKFQTIQTEEEFEKNQKGTTNMKTNVATRWINALQNGKYKKTTGVLKRTDGSYCALGVLCDLYKKQGGPLREKPAINPEEDRDDAVSLGGEVQLPPKKVLNWAGLGIIQAEEIAKMNDQGDSFNKIARHIKKNREIL